MFKNKQEAYDTVCNRLAKQGIRAYNGNGNVYGNGCVYRTDGGLACAVGCLIPDNDPALYYLGGVGALLKSHPHVKYFLSIEGESGVDLNFWQCMQDAHDRSLSLKDVQERFLRLAESFGLSAEKVELFTSWSSSR